MPTTTGKATDLITFSRGSLATVTDADGKIKWAPHNLLLASEQFDASSWTKLGTTVGANNVVAPNGTTTADTITEGAGSGNRSVFPASPPSIVSGQNYTASVFLKAGTRRYVQVCVGPIFGTSQENFGVIVDTSLTPMTIVTTGNGTSGTYVSSSISAVSNGFYLVSVTGNVASTLGYLSISGTDNTTYSITPSSSGSQTFLAWGASLTRADLGGMQNNPSAYPYYNPSTKPNLVGYSEDFSNAAWSKSGSGTATAVTANAAAAPNGSLTADRITQATAINIYQGYATVNTTPYRFSVYLKQSGTVTSCELYAFSTGTFTNVTLASFNFTTGVATNTTGSGATMTPVGDGWYRCMIVVTGTGVTLNFGLSGATEVLAWGAQLSDSASLDPYVPSFGPAPSAAAAHGARLDYDPVTLAAKGLLVEETRQNLLSYSSEMDNSGVWARNTSRTTTAANQIAAPDGTVTATKITTISASSSGTYLARVSGISTSAGAFCVSVYAKKGTSNGWIALQAGDGTNYYTAWYNLNTGVKGGTSTTGTDFTAKNHDIVNVGGGWYRIWITITRTTTAAFSAYVYTDCSADQSYQSTLNNFDYAWGGQVEAATFPTSFIQTIGNQTVTRNADVASVGVSQFPYSASEGTLVANVQTFTSATAQMAQLDNTDTNRLQLAFDGLTMNYAVVVAGSAVVALSATKTASVKAAAAYKLDDFAVSFNGGAAITDTSGTVPVASMLRLGSTAASGSYLNGWVRQITYLPRRLTNAELAARSA